MKNQSSSNPLVSICIPTFNGEVFIEEALESAIGQNYPNLEIVVTDDASKDRTLDIVNTFKKKTDIPIHVFNHEPNGIGANWNFCIKKSSGDYIKFLFQDDTLSFDCVTKMMAIAIQNPNVGLIYCERDFLVETKTHEIKEFIDFYGNLHQHWDSVNVSQSIQSGKNYLKDRQFLNSPRNKIGEPTAVLLKKECFKNIGWFNEKLKQTLDYEYWYRVMKAYDVAFIQEKLVSFRLHESQASQVNKGNDISNEEIFLLYKEFYDHIYWQLHPKNKLKLLKWHHPLIKGLVALKRRMNG